MKFYRVLFDDIINYYSKEKVKLNYIYTKENMDSYFIYGYINKNDVCEEIRSNYYLNFKIYEVNLYDNLRISKNRIYANKMEFLKEVDYDEFINDEYLNNSNPSLYKEIIKIIKNPNDSLLDKYVNCNLNIVRAAVAHVGRDCDLDKLVYDNSICVRREVSKHGRKKDLEILKNDVDASLKTEVLMMLKNKSKEKQKELINENKR